mgnify:CR=1 FL=1
MIDMKIETQCLHEGYTPANGEPLTLPIYQSTTYKYESTAQVAKLFDLTDDGHMYSRISNPTVAAVEEKTILSKPWRTIASRSTSVPQRLLL